MSMTSRDFREIAEAVYWATLEHDENLVDRGVLLHRLAGIMAGANPRFDRERFEKAAKLGPVQIRKA